MKRIINPKSLIILMMIVLMSCQEVWTRRASQSSSRSSASGHSSHHSVPHSGGSMHHASAPPSYHPQAPYHSQPSAMAYHPHSMPQQQSLLQTHNLNQRRAPPTYSGAQQLRAHASPPPKMQALPQRPITKKVTTSTTSTYIPPPRAAVSTTRHVTHIVQAPAYQPAYQPYHPSGFNVGGTHVHLHMGVPTLFGGSGLYETGPAAYGTTTWTHHHYHRSSIWGEIAIMLVFVLVMACIIVACCTLCKSDQYGNEEYIEEYQEENGRLIVEHKELKEEIFEDYNPHQNEDLNTHQEEVVEYTYHPDGGRTEKRTVKKTEYDFGGAPSSHYPSDPTQASQGPMSSYGRQFNNNNYQQNYPNQQYMQQPQNNNYGYQYHNPQSNQMQ